MSKKSIIALATLVAFSVPSFAHADCLSLSELGWMVANGKMSQQTAVDLINDCNSDPDCGLGEEAPPNSDDVITTKYGYDMNATRAQMAGTTYKPLKFKSSVKNIRLQYPQEIKRLPSKVILQPKR